MRYFETSNANREYKVGGFTFRFDPADNLGGAWTGVLSIESEEAADALATNLKQVPQIKEITEKEYTDIKKKDQPHSSSYSQLKAPSADRQSRSVLAAHVEVEGTPNSSSNEKPAPTLDEAVKLGSAHVVDELAEVEPATPAKRGAKSKRAHG